MSLSHDLGLPKIRVPLLRIPEIRILAYWCLYWGPLFLGNSNFISGISCGEILRSQKGRTNLRVALCSGATEAEKIIWDY